MNDQDNTYQYDPNHYDSGSGLRKVAAGVGVASAAGGAYAWHKGGELANRAAVATRNQSLRDKLRLNRHAKSNIPLTNHQLVTRWVGKPTTSKATTAAIEAATKRAGQLKLGGKIGAGVAVLGLGGAVLHKASN